MTSRDEYNDLVAEETRIRAKMLDDTFNPPTTTGSGVVSGHNFPLDEYDPGPVDPMDETDFGNRYVVYVSYNSVAAEEESCRHSVMAPSAYEAALKAVKGCRLLSYEITAVAEVFPHTGTEHRFSYQLTYHA